MRGHRRFFANLLTQVVLLVAILCAMFPLLWVLLTSFKTNRDATASAAQALSFHPMLANYSNLFGSSEFMHAARTSLVVTVVTTLVVVVVATLGGYGLARLRVPARRALTSIMVVVQVIPGIVLVIPLFRLISSVGLYDRAEALIVVMIGLGTPFATWLILAFIRSSPVEIEEAAIIDGANQFQVFRYVLIPIIAPGIATAGIFTAMSTWNVFLMPVVLGQSRAQTLTVFAAQFVTQQQIEWGSLCATAIVILAPIVIFVVSMQRSLVKGVTTGSLKA